MPFECVFYEASFNNIQCDEFVCLLSVRKYGIIKIQR